MPDRSKVQWSQLKVGIVALVSFVIVFALVFLLTSSQGIFTHDATLVTYMDDASGVAAATPVRLNGIIVGYLGAVRLTASRDPRRTVEFQLVVRERFLKDIPVDSVAGISAANLLGDKFVNITKGRSTQTVKPGAELQSAEAQDIPELLAQSAGLLQSLQTILGRADSLLAGVEAGQGNLGKFIKDEELYNRLNAVAAEGQKLLIDVRTGKGTISKLLNDDELYQEVRAPLKRLDALMANLQAGQGTAGKLLKDPALFDEAQQTLTELRGLMADLNAGKGTAGKLLKDDQLYQRINTLVLKFDSTVDKINSGQGTLGQLMVNPALYDSLNGATREFQSLARDMRANPKKFLTIRLTLF
jgi:phospholipid/cholesterol/gamma-HCH transport system substrate-binding protein